MKYLVRLIILGLSAALCSQSLMARELIGLIQLDVAPTLTELRLEIEVRNHSFVVLPTLAFIRPITSRESTVVTLAPGQGQLSYQINNIIDDPVDYTIRIRCLNCDDLAATQYYTTNGNVSSLIDSAYIDPDDLPEELNLVINTKSQISGTVSLQNNEAAARTLRFDIQARAAGNPSTVLSSRELQLQPGQLSVDYLLTNINRNVGPIQLRAQCLNCGGAAARSVLFPTLLDSTSNHANSDWSLLSTAPPPMGAIIMLLLDD